MVEVTLGKHEEYKRTQMGKSGRIRKYFLNEVRPNPVMKMKRKHSKITVNLVNWQYFTMNLTKRCAAGGEEHDYLNG